MTINHKFKSIYRWSSSFTIKIGTKIYLNKIWSFFTKTVKYFDSVENVCCNISNNRMLYVCCNMFVDIIYVLDA